MRESRRHIHWPNLCRRFTASVALLAYLAASFGLPMPVAAAFKDRSRPYPCMNNPCGCTCAEDCWRHCCCTTPEERWAWAAAHNVQPPDYAERPGQQSGSHPTNACPHCHEQETGKKTPAAPGMSFASPLRCKGLTTLWVGSGTTPVPTAFVWLPALVLADRLTSHDQFAFHLSQAPLAPPPR